MRNPALLETTWPKLWKELEDVRLYLFAARRDHPELEGLAACMGSSPTHNPPSEQLLASIRRGLEVCWGLPEGAAEKRHPSSPWRYELVRALGAAWKNLQPVKGCSLARTVTPG